MVKSELCARGYDRGDKTVLTGWLIRVDNMSASAEFGRSLVCSYDITDYCKPLYWPKAYGFLFGLSQVSQRPLRVLLVLVVMRRPRWDKSEP